MFEKFEDTERVIRSRHSKKDKTIRWPKDKGQLMIYKTLHRRRKTEYHEPTKTGVGGFRCSGMKRYTIYLFIESIPEKKVLNATITLLTVTENLCHKWPCICSICCNHNPVLSSFMTYHWVCNKSNTTCATCGAGTLYPSRAQRFTPGF